MPAFIAIPIKEANALRGRFQNLLLLRQAYLLHPEAETVHDLRVASRRAREVLDYMEPLLPQRWYQRLMNLSRQITRSLGRVREAEVNLSLLQSWKEKKKIDPVVAELLIYSQLQDFERRNLKARKRIFDREFVEIEKFLDRLRGTYRILSTNSGVLERRHREFLAFPWDGVMDDEHLHDLRIRTKTFRYAVEIYDRLHARNMGRFTRRIRNLQEVLGRLHDLYVLSELIRIEKEKWDASNLEILPPAFTKAYEWALSEKSKHYPRVLPLYSRILENSPLVVVGPTARALA